MNVIILQMNAYKQLKQPKQGKEPFLQISTFPLEPPKPLIKGQSDIFAPQTIRQLQALFNTLYGNLTHRASAELLRSIKPFPTSAYKVSLHDLLQNTIRLIFNPPYAEPGIPTVINDKKKNHQEQTMKALTNQFASITIGISNTLLSLLNITWLNPTTTHSKKQKPPLNFTISQNEHDKQDKGNALNPVARVTLEEWWEHIKKQISKLGGDICSDTSSNELNCREENGLKELIIDSIKKQLNTPTVQPNKPHAKPNKPTITPQKDVLRYTEITEIPKLPLFNLFSQLLQLAIQRQPVLKENSQQIFDLGINPTIIEHLLRTDAFRPITTFIINKLIIAIKGEFNSIMQATTSQDLDNYIKELAKQHDETLIKHIFKCLLHDGSKTDSSCEKQAERLYSLYLASKGDLPNIDLKPIQRKKIRALFDNMGRQAILYILNYNKPKEYNKLPDKTQEHIETIIDIRKTILQLFHETIAGTILNLATILILYFPLMSNSLNQLNLADALMHPFDIVAKPPMKRQLLFPETVINTTIANPEEIKEEILKIVSQIHEYNPQIYMSHTLLDGLLKSIYKKDPTIFWNTLTSSNKTTQNTAVEYPRDDINEKILQLSDAVAGTIWFRALNESRIMAGMHTRLDVGAVELSHGLETIPTSPSGRTRLQEVIQQIVRFQQKIEQDGVQRNHNDNPNTIASLDIKTGNHLNDASIVQYRRMLLLLIAGIFVETRKQGQGIIEWLNEFLETASPRFRIISALLVLWGPATTADIMTSAQDKTNTQSALKTKWPRIREQTMPDSNGFQKIITELVKDFQARLNMELTNSINI